MLLQLLHCAPKQLGSKSTGMQPVGVTCATTFVCSCTRRGTTSARSACVHLAHWLSTVTVRVATAVQCTVNLHGVSQRLQRASNCKETGSRASMPPMRRAVRCTPTAVLPTGTVVAESA